jgi:glycosyltransferase involved in cell wall biosynthesis
VNILLAQKLPYQSFTGASKANRMLMEALARRNHSCRMVVFPSSPSEATTVFAREGVEVHAVSRIESFEAYLLEQVTRLAPDVILISEDRSYLSLLAATESDVPVVFVCHSQATLPFGPASFEFDPTKTDVLRRASAIVAPSQYVCDYIRRWGGIDSTLFRFDTYGRGPFPDLARFGEGSVLMINPSQIKGLPVFLELARRFPTTPFLAIPTWATVADDYRELDRLPNVRLMKPFDSIDDLFRQATALLVPSLWGEAFPTSVIEAMLRGIPVLASNVGGLPEAKLGVDYVLPVAPIERYERDLDSHHLPIPAVPRRDAVRGTTARFTAIHSRRAGANGNRPFSRRPTVA